MVSERSGSQPSPTSIEREAASARLALLVVLAIVAFLWVLGGTVDTFVTDFPYFPLVFIAPPVASLILARKHRSAVLSDVIIRGQFVSVGRVFGGAGVVVAAFSAIDGRWETPLWVLTAAAGIGTLFTLRKPRGS